MKFLINRHLLSKILSSETIDASPEEAVARAEALIADEDDDADEVTVVRLDHPEYSQVCLATFAIVDDDEDVVFDGETRRPLGEGQALRQVLNEKELRRAREEHPRQVEERRRRAEEEARQRAEEEEREAKQRALEKERDEKQRAADEATARGRK